MHLASILSLMAASLFWTTIAHDVQATIYSGPDCTGNAEFIYIDVSSSYCFSFRGQSFGSASYNVNYVSSAKLVTWSEDICGGSSATFYPIAGDNSDCTNIPFAAAQLVANYR